MQKTSDDMRISDWSSDVCASVLRQTMGECGGMANAMIVEALYLNCPVGLVRRALWCPYGSLSATPGANEQLNHASPARGNGPRTLPPARTISVLIGPLA